MLPVIRVDFKGGAGSNLKAAALFRPAASRNTRPSRTPRPKGRTWPGSRSTMTGAVRLRRPLDRVQMRPGHQLEADPGTASRLWPPDDGLMSSRGEPTRRTARQRHEHQPIGRAGTAAAALSPCPQPYISATGIRPHRTAEPGPILSRVTP